MDPLPLKAFGEYIDHGDTIVSTLVTHPLVQDRLRFTRCSIVLQRAVLVSNPPTETMYLRSYFHSTAGGSDFVNFAPTGGLQVAYESDHIWFPLRLTSFITEPASYVVLDVLTPNGIDAGSVPKVFHVANRGKVELDGHTYIITRLEGILSAKEEWPDLRLQPR